MLYKVLHKIIVAFFICLFKLFIKEIKGIGNIPKGGAVIVSNHASFFDPPLITAIIYDKLNIKVHYLAKIELSKSLFGRVFCKSVESIPLDTAGKDKSGLEKAVEYLKKGGLIGMFPEGGRSKDGKLQKGKTGAVRLALKARVPIVPVGIKGAYDVWPRQKKKFRIKKIIEVNFGEPIYLNEYYSRKITKKLLRVLTNNVMKKIGKLCGQEYKY